ncbi:uncharacterized protein JCM6883_000989 [Sporobolomyces salmoneus]|uniref:uncharacterized protein n=1 Tax=Sporobolomyces salmoneus TaxID=183962 RepID=UPI00317A9BFF
MFNEGLRHLVRKWYPFATPKVCDYEPKDFHYVGQGTHVSNRRESLLWKFQVPAVRLPASWGHPSLGNIAEMQWILRPAAAFTVIAGPIALRTEDPSRPLVKTFGPPARTFAHMHHFDVYYDLSDERKEWISFSQVNQFANCQFDNHERIKFLVQHSYTVPNRRRSLEHLTNYFEIDFVLPSHLPSPSPFTPTARPGSSSSPQTVVTNQSGMSS